MNPAAQKLLSFLERIERLEEERKTLADDIADIYSELKADGYDKDAAKIVLKIRKTKDGLDQWTGKSSTVDAYLSALGMLPPMIEARAGAPARENIEQFPPHNPETGELTDTQEQPGEPATIQPDPLPPVVDDGQPSPSANVPPAQKASPRSDVGQAGVKPGISSGEFAQQSASAAQTRNEPGSASGASVTLPQSEIPAFLRKSAADYRPNCQHPDACGSSNPTGHCYTCKRAMEAAESEVA